MKTIKEIDFRDKKVFLRSDLNVPLGDGKVDDDSRLRATLPTINYIINQQPKLLLMVSHLGRPEGEFKEELSMRKLVPSLEKYLERRIVLIEELEKLTALIQADTHDLEAVYLLENIRFWKEEELGDDDFGRRLGELFDVYVNDAFSVSHRDHATITRVPRYTKERCAGLLLAEEWNKLSQVKDQPEHPAVAVIGGAKIATKLPVIENLKNNYDKILVGGLVANEALDEGYDLGKKVLLPVDFAPENKSDQRLDIGPKTVALFEDEIKKAKTIVWNGPMGKFEDEEAARGTREVMKAITENSQPLQVVGGGETIEAIKSFGDFSDFDYVSMSGGAMLEFLAGKELPGIKALEQ